MKKKFLLFFLSLFIILAVIFLALLFLYWKNTRIYSPNINSQPLLTSNDVVTGKIVEGSKIHHLCQDNIGFIANDTRKYILHTMDGEKLKAFYDQNLIGNTVQLTVKSTESPTCEALICGCLTSTLIFSHLQKL